VCACSSVDPCERSEMYAHPTPPRLHTHNLGSLKLREAAEIRSRQLCALEIGDAVMHRPRVAGDIVCLHVIPHTLTYVPLPRVTQLVEPCGAGVGGALHHLSFLGYSAIGSVRLNILQPRPKAHTCCICCMASASFPSLSASYACSSIARPPDSTSC